VDDDGEVELGGQSELEDERFALERALRTAPGRCIVQPALAHRRPVPRAPLLGVRRAGEQVELPGERRVAHGVDGPGVDAVADGARDGGRQTEEVVELSAARAVVACDDDVLDAAAVGALECAHQVVVEDVEMQMRVCVDHLEEVKRWA